MMFVSGWSSPRLAEDANLGLNSPGDGKGPMQEESEELGLELDRTGDPDLK